MKKKHLRDLLTRAAAVIENPDSAIRSHREELIEDLIVVANDLDQPDAGDCEPTPAGECGEEAVADIARRIASYTEGTARTNVYKAAKLALTWHGEGHRALLKELAGIFDQINDLPLNDDGTRELPAGMLDRAREIAAIAFGIQRLSIDTA